MCWTDVNFLSNGQRRTVGNVNRPMFFMLLVHLSIVNIQNDPAYTVRICSDGFMSQIEGHPIGGRHANDTTQEECCWRKTEIGEEGRVPMIMKIKVPGDASTPGVLA